MQAIVCTQYGPPDLLQFKEVPKPAPGNNEVLIKLYAASVNRLDSFTMRGPLFFLPALGKLLKPKNKIPGCDIAGRVEAIGRDIKQFQPDDEVYGGNLVGGFAEYVCVPEHTLALKPSNLSFEDAAAVPVAAITALQGLHDHGQIKTDQKVLIDGASGGVGTFAIQIAKHFGAEVTAVCSTRNIDIARQLGADHVIDYAREDFAKSRQRYDLILGANAHHSIFAYMRMLNPGGIFVLVGGNLSQILPAMLFGPILSQLGSKKFRFFIAKMNTKDLTLLKDLLEAAKIVPMIDRRYPLSEAAEALRYREEGHAQGKVVITIEQVT